RLVDEVKRLQRAGDDQDIVGCRGETGIALELCREEIAQGPITLRSAGKSVGRKRPALALQDGGDGIEQPVDRNLFGIVVAAYKAVFRKSSPFRRRRGQSRRQKRRE